MEQIAGLVMRAVVLFGIVLSWRSMAHTELASGNFCDNVVCELSEHNQ